MPRAYDKKINNRSMNPQIKTKQDYLQETLLFSLRQKITKLNPFLTYNRNITH